MHVIGIVQFRPVLVKGQLYILKELGKDFTRHARRNSKLRKWHEQREKWEEAELGHREVLTGIGKEGVGTGSIEQGGN